MALGPIRLEISSKPKTNYESTLDELFKNEKKNLKFFGPIFEYAQKRGFPLNEKMTPRVGVKPKKLPTIRKLIL